MNQKAKFHSLIVAIIIPNVNHSEKNPKMLEFTFEWTERIECAIFH